MHISKILVCLILISLSGMACETNKMSRSDFNKLENLPPDLGGTHQAHQLQLTDSPYGFYVYAPSTDVEHVKFPLLVFLHGSGERGNSSEDIQVLDRVFKHGPPKLINQNEWQPSYPVIVASPQCHDTGWFSNNVHEFIKYVIDNYPVNTDRIYLTGLSMGGYGTFDYVYDYGDNGFVSACVPICGGGKTNQTDNYKNIPFWAFHGDEDHSVPVQKSISTINAINELRPEIKAKLTIYPGVAHDSWTQTYNSRGIGSESEDYDAFDQPIYDWMFQYHR